MWEKNENSVSFLCNFDQKKQDQNRDGIAFVLMAVHVFLCPYCQAEQERASHAEEVVAYRLAVI